MTIKRSELKTVVIAMGITLLTLLILACVVMAQKPNPFKLDPESAESWELQALQQKAINAQTQLQVVQQNYQTAVKTLTDKGVEIRKKKGWPDTVEFNPNFQSIEQAYGEPPPQQPPPPQAPPPAPPKAQEKK